MYCLKGAPSKTVSFSCPYLSRGLNKFQVTGSSCFCLIVSDKSCTETTVLRARAASDNLTNICWQWP